MSTSTPSVIARRLQAKARIRHLQLIVLLSELGSLKKAAEAMHLSQPAVTQILSDLESLLDMPLFERLARGVKPTPTGKALIPIAQRILHAISDTSETVSAIKRQGEGVVRIAAIAGAISGLLVRALPNFSEKHPEIQITVVEADASGWSTLLANQEVDLVICRRPVVLPTAHRFVPVLTDRYVIACHSSFAPSFKRHASWKAWSKELWLPSSLGSLARQTLDNLQEQLEIEFNQHPVTARVLSLTWALLKSKRMVTLVPYSVVQQLHELGEMAVFEPPKPLPFQPIGLLFAEEGAGFATTKLADYIASKTW